MCPLQPCAAGPGVVKGLYYDDYCACDYHNSSSSTTYGIMKKNPSYSDAHTCATVMPCFASCTCSSSLSLSSGAVAVRLTAPANPPETKSLHVRDSSAHGLACVGGVVPSRVPGRVLSASMGARVVADGVVSFTLRRADAFLTSTAAFLPRREAMQQGGDAYMVEAGAPVWMQALQDAHEGSVGQATVA